MRAVGELKAPRFSRDRCALFPFALFAHGGFSLLVRYQPNRDYVSNDEVQTPRTLAKSLVKHFKPRGRILEPCCGDGNFLRALRQQARASGGSADRWSTVSRPHMPVLASAVSHRSGVHWCEIKRGRDFFAWSERVDWIITNPPWSQIRPFLQHAMRVTDNVVFLLTINHVWTRARIRDIRTAGFGLREIVLVDMPSSFPQSRFQLGAVHVQRGWSGAITLTDWTEGAGTNARDRQQNPPPAPPLGVLPLESSRREDRPSSEYGWIPELLRRYPASQRKERIR